MKKHTVKIFLILLSFNAIAFNIEQQDGSTDLIITWNPPTARENGDPLPQAEIGGYSILWARQRDAEPQRINIPPTPNRYVFRNASEGAYYFAMLTRDNTGMDGLLSPVIEHIVTLDRPQPPTCKDWIIDFPIPIDTRMNKYKVIAEFTCTTGRLSYQGCYGDFCIDAVVVE